MTSTYIDYRIYTRDITRTLKRVEQQVEVSREAEYYRANIGKVKSVDDFLADQRLYAYAMTAHGMSDMIYAKAFMRKVLESDLNDPKSFARSLVDTRYQAFARVFQFTADGTVSKGLHVAQTEAQEDDTVGLYTEHRTRRGEAAAAEVQNYQARIGIMTSVDDFLRDDRLLSVALTAFGFDPKHASLTTIRNVLTSDLSDPGSVANTLGDDRYVALAAAFGFEPDGSVPAGLSAQSAGQMEDLLYLYYEATGNGASPAAAAFKTGLYSARVAAVTNVDEFLADPKLFAYALTAYGLDPSLHTTADIRLVLTSDLSDPASFANQLPDDRYRTLAAAFNFLPDGSIGGSGEAQTAAQIEDTTELYFTHYNTKATDADALETSYFENRVVSIVNKEVITIAKVDELLNDSRLYAYLLKSYDLDPATESKAFIRRVLTSDVADPKSFVNTLRDTRYRVMAAAVNFAADGTVTTPLRAQSEADELATVRRYTALLGADATQAAKKAVSDESLYYHDAIAKVTTVDGLIADKRLVTFVLKAYGLEGQKLTDNELKRILTSDPMDKRSFANTFAKDPTDTRYRTLAAAFNFTAEGKIRRVPPGEVQTRNDLLATADLYLLQTMEVEAGAQNEGVRLALYFRRKAPTLDSAFSILADKALLEVARTALSLPASFSQLDIDAQAKFISRRIKIEDLKDPAKLDKFLAQFSALYDMNNSTGLASSPAALLLSGNEDTGIIGQGLLASMQNVRRGGF